MIPAGIDVVVFDAVGTLLHPEPPAATVYGEIGRRFGGRYSAQAISQRFAAAFTREEEADRAAGWNTGEDRERRRWRNIVASVLDDVQDQDACFAELYQHFARPQAWRCEADTATILKELSVRGYRLGMASNYDHRLRTVVAGLPELKPITHLIISSEIGWRKPAPQFFDAISQAVQAPPERILYIGDDPINDYEGASAAGIRALLYDPRGKHVCLAAGHLSRLTGLL